MSSCLAVILGAFAFLATCTLAVGKRWFSFRCIAFVVIAFVFDSYKDVAGIPVFVFGAMMIWAYYVILLQAGPVGMGHPRIHHRCSARDARVLEVLCLLALAFLSISTLLGQKAFHYWRSVGHSFILLGTAVILFRIFKRDKGAVLAFALGLLIRGSITSFFVLKLFADSHALVRGFPQDSILTELYGIAGHSGSILLGLLGGIIVLGYRAHGMRTGNAIFSTKVVYLLMIGMMSSLLPLGSRGALLTLATTVAIGVVVFLSSSRSGRTRGASVLLVLIFLSSLVGAVLVGMEFGELIPSLQERAAQDVGQPDFLGRLLGSRRADNVRLVLQNTQMMGLLGKGRGTANQLTGQIYDIGVHNAYLEILVDGGVIAVTCFVSMLLVWLWRGWSWRKGYPLLSFFALSAATYIAQAAMFSGVTHQLIIFLVAITTAWYTNLSSMPRLPRRCNNERRRKQGRSLLAGGTDLGAGQLGGTDS